MRSTGSPTGTHIYLAFEDLHDTWRGEDPNGVHNCRNGKIGRLRRPSRVGNLGDLVAPSLDSRRLISPLVPCLGLLHGCKRKLCLPLATRVGVQSVRETFLTLQSLKHTIYGEKCIYWRYWRAYIYGPLRNKNMSERFLSWPIVSVSNVHTMVRLSSPTHVISVCIQARVQRGSMARVLTRSRHLK